MREAHAPTYVVVDVTRVSCVCVSDCVMCARHRQHAERKKRKINDQINKRKRKRKIKKQRNDISYLFLLVYY